MKQFRNMIGALVCAVSLLVVPIGGSGCKSPARNAYVASGATHVSVAAGLKGWNEYLGAKDAELTTLAATEPAKATAERAKLGSQTAQLESAYRKYQAAQLAVLTAAEEFSKIPKGDPNQSAATDKLTAASAAYSATMASVLNLLKEFGIKVQ
jgi:hypothetical protein